MSEDTAGKTSGLPSKKVLGLFALAMINVAAVLSIRNFPSMAIYGWSCIGWYVLGAILFLIPISLAGAELATGWPEGGGVYAWVKQAFGEKGGFTALFCEWSNNLVWFPTVLSFIASTLAFALTPGLAANPWYMFSVMMIAFWGTTAIAYFGEELSAKFSNIGVILGSIIPAVLIILLGVWWLGSGQTLVLPPFSFGAMIPSIDMSTLPFFATIVLLFAGMEMAGFHALETRDPQKDFPRAMALSAFIIVICTVLATLAIAVVIPADQLNLWLTDHAIPVTPAFSDAFLDLGQGATLKVVSVSPRGAVLLVEWQGFRALLPVGMNFDTLAELDNGIKIGRVSVLLLADSGFAQVNPPEWIAALHPPLAILSVAAGDPDGLPEQSVLDELAGTTLLRTDWNGWIEVSTDGIGMWVDVEKK
ncbi:MAG: amino acid permease [Methanoregula sp.]